MLIEVEGGAGLFAVNGSGDDEHVFAIDFGCGSAGFRELGRQRLRHRSLFRGQTTRRIGRGSLLDTFGGGEPGHGAVEALLLASVGALGIEPGGFGAGELGGDRGFLCKGGSVALHDEA